MSRRWMVVLVAAASIAGCSKARSTAGQGESPPNDLFLAQCTGCHGDATANTNAAPPLSVHGVRDTTAIGVGAHQQHLQSDLMHVRQGIACSECHVVPQTIDAPGHIDKDRADITFGPLASSGNVTPIYNRSSDGTTATCTTYCHGQPSWGGTNHAPTWTVVDGSQAGCGTCHGLPPPPPHPAAANITVCTNCHPQTINQAGQLDLAYHINGIIDLIGGQPGCTNCHGDPTRADASLAPAPPRDLLGNQTSTSPGVGAHLPHLLGGAIRSGLSCAECHLVPTSLTHPNGVIDLPWNALAKTNSTTPTFDATNLTCTNYCHGDPTFGGTNHSPKWTGGSAEAACGTCHGLPPPAPHPGITGGVTACTQCHAGTVKPDGTIDTSTGKHINGTPDISAGGCTICHGDATRDPSIAAAPPRAINGSTATTSDGVGAHQSHLTAATFVGTPIGCGECHIVPNTFAHASGGINLLTWGPLASANGTNPTPPPSTSAALPSPVTCTNWCHGQATWGGSNRTPTWTIVNGTQAACGTCHALPPPDGRHNSAAHIGFIANCQYCHGDGYSIASVVKATHVDGTKTIATGTPFLISWTPPTPAAPQGACLAACHSTSSRPWYP